MREIGVSSELLRVFPISAALSMFPPRSPSLPPRKRGPRDRGGADVTVRSSVQMAVRRHDTRVHAPFVSPAKAGAQEPRWRRCYGADLSAVGIPPARCSGFLEKPAPSVLRRLWWFDVLLVAMQSSVVPGSWAPAILPGRENEGQESGGPGTVVVRLSRSGPQRSGPSVGRAFRRALGF